MTELNIRRIVFCGNIDKIDLISFWSVWFIHIDGQGYYYSEKKKCKNHVLNILSKLKHIEKLNILDTIHILLLKLVAIKY